MGTLAALDALINNWDRWPLPTLWQKSRTHLEMSVAELRAACMPLRRAGEVDSKASAETASDAGGEVGGKASSEAPAGESAAVAAAVACDALLRSCGCNLGNVLVHPSTQARLSCTNQGNRRHAQPLFLCLRVPSHAGCNEH